GRAGRRALWRPSPVQRGRREARLRSARFWWRYRASRSEDNAGIAQVAVAVDEVDLPDLDFPTPRALDEAVAAPTRQKSRPVHAKLADQEIGADHAHGVLAGGEYFDIRDHPHRAGFRRLRPSITGAQAIDPVLHAPAIVERHRDLPPRVTAFRRSRHPIDAFGRIHCQPFVEAQLIEQARFALEQQAETIAYLGRGDCQLLALPIAEVFHQVAIELVVDVIGTDRGIVDGLHVHAHGSR